MDFGRETCYLLPLLSPVVEDSTGASDLPGSRGFFVNPFESLDASISSRFRLFSLGFLGIATTGLPCWCQGCRPWICRRVSCGVSCRALPISFGPSSSNSNPHGPHRYLTRRLIRAIAGASDPQRG